MSKPGNRVFKEIPLEMVGGNKFGRDPKISVEQTWNFIITDGWLAPFAGWRKVQTIATNDNGRGIFSVPKLNLMFVVIGNKVYKEDINLNRTLIGTLNTFVGDVYIEANNYDNPIVLFSDNQYLYQYDTAGAGTFTQLTIGFTPGYIGFQNDRFICPDRTSSDWRLSDIGSNPITFTDNAQHVGSIRTKSDNALAAIRVPEKGNELLVFGSIVTEQWYDIPSNASLFPYQRSTNSNIDYGLANAASLAAGDKFVVWVGLNEKSGVTIMYTDGQGSKQISTDGINYALARLTNPTNCYGFLYRQDGHVVYIVTFPDDNITYMYDFTNNMFFYLSDHELDHHPAKRVAFFNNKYYFISFYDGDLYELSSEYYTADGNTIPRIRVCPHIRLPDQSPFILSNIGFTIEQGQVLYDDRDTSFGLATEDDDFIITENGLILGGGENFRNNVPSVDFSLSKDGGVSFGSNDRKELNPYGIRQNRLWWLRQGRGNDMVPQFWFWVDGRILVTNGLASIYQ